jgi:hypothetical protein
MSERIQDRLVTARDLCKGKRVLDIGGQCMPAGSVDSGFAQSGRGIMHLFGLESKDPTQSRFAKLYRSIGQAAKEHRVVDYHDVPPGHYEIDFNKADSVEKLRRAIDEFKPEVILCMETLEHVNYRFEMMNEMARSVALYNTTVFVTIPNNANWFLNALGWNSDHSVAFFKDIAKRFVYRSDLGQHDVKMFGCMQQYFWFWRLVYAGTLFQPFSWAFLVRPKAKFEK